MTQSPSPFPPQSPHQPPAPYVYGAQPPGYGFHQLGTDVLKPARRAAVLMIVLGALVALFGACNAVTALVMTPEMVAEQRSAMKAAGLPESPVSPEGERIGRMIAGTGTLVTGTAFIVIGLFVRRGTRAAIVTALVLSSGLAIVMGLFLLMCVILALAAPPIAVLACLVAIPLLLLVWQIVWLVQAARVSGAVASAQNQFNAQFYQYQQFQQAYAYPAPPGYGYGYGYGYPASPQQQQPQQQSLPAQTPPNPEPAPPAPPPSDNPPPPPATS